MEWFVTFSVSFSLLAEVLLLELAGKLKYVCDSVHEVFDSSSQQYSTVLYSVNSADAFLESVKSLTKVFSLLFRCSFNT